jgi:hypothetical protein
MNTSPTELDYRAVRVWAAGRMIFIERTDGRQIGFPTDRLAAGAARTRHAAHPHSITQP